MTRLLIDIDVDDVDRATTFYVEALDLRVGRRLAGGAVVEFLGAEPPIYLLSKDAGTLPFEGASVKRDYARHWSPVHLDVVVDDLEAALARAEAAGAKCESEITTHAWGRIARLADPFGHGVCLVEFSERGYDAIVDEGSGDHG